MQSSEEVIIGIDLGTTNSEVAVISEGIPELVMEDGDAILPSCVGVDESGRIIVGQQARNQAIASPHRTVLSIKRLMGTDTRVPMGDCEYSPQEISAFILRALKERAERALGHPVARAVITVPAYFTDAQRKATREAGSIAGLEVVRIINEPTAAALTYEQNAKERRTVLVYDLGGGTFDVSVVSIERGVVEVLASTGNNQLGGNDFDELILESLNSHIESELGIADCRQDSQLQARLRRAAEQTKIALSTELSHTVEEDHIGRAFGENRHLVYEMTRQDFQSLIEDLLSGTLRSVSDAMNEANRTASELDRVLLVGGSTRIPRISEMLADQLGKQPHAEVDPDMCVALGAGIQAGVEMGQDMQAVLVDVTPYTFGTEILSDEYPLVSKLKYVPMIRRNSKLPATYSDLFYTLHDEVDRVKVTVYQGEDPVPDNNILIGSCFLEGLNEVPEAFDEGILFTFDLDLSGILKVHAQERHSGKEVRLVIDNAMDELTQEEIDEARKRAEELWSGEPGDHGQGAGWSSAPKISRETERQDANRSGSEKPDDVVADLKRQIGSLSDKMDEEDRQEIEQMIEALELALKDSDSKKVQRMQQEIEDLLFFID